MAIDATVRHIAPPGYIIERTVSSSVHTENFDFDVKDADNFPESAVPADFGIAVEFLVINTNDGQGHGDYAAFFRVHAMLTVNASGNPSLNGSVTVDGDTGDDISAATISTTGTNVRLELTWTAAAGTDAFTTVVCSFPLMQRFTP